MTEISHNVAGETPLRKLYLFDIFRGEVDSSGTIRKVRSVGIAAHGEGQKTYKVSLKTFINFDFFLMKESQNKNIDYALLTREAPKKAGRKYFWHMVGEGKLLLGANSGLLNLCWDVFPAENIYMSLHPKEVREVSDMSLQESD